MSVRVVLAGNAQSATPGLWPPCVRMSNTRSRGAAACRPQDAQSKGAPGSPSWGDFQTGPPLPKKVDGRRIMKCSHNLNWAASREVLGLVRHTANPQRDVCANAGVRSRTQTQIQGHLREQRAARSVVSSHQCSQCGKLFRVGRGERVVFQQNKLPSGMIDKREEPAQVGIQHQRACALKLLRLGQPKFRPSWFGYVGS